MNTVPRFLFLVCLLISSACWAQTPLTLPAGTTVSASFPTDDGKGAGNLIDGNSETMMIGAAGSAPTPDTGSSIFFRFPEPLTGLGGVKTGKSDPFQNYYPIAMEFWVDSDGDGTFDTKVGRTSDLGPGDKSVGDHLFDGRLEKVYGLEVRVVEQSAKSLKRAFQMGEIGLIASKAMPVIPAVPAARPASALFYQESIPAGTTATTTLSTEQENGADKLLDGNLKTLMNPVQGTAGEGKVDSVFLKFPAAVDNLAGISLGGGDPFGNYVWQTMEIWADTMGDGKYNTKAATIRGGAAGEFRFDKALPKVYGLDLRVTKTKLGNAMRSFILSEVTGLTFADDSDGGKVKYVLEDFEDFASWRTWGVNTDQPEGERSYGKNIWLCGINDPKRAKAGQGVGEFRYWFKNNGETKRTWAKRGTVAEKEMLIERLEFWANPRGYPAMIWFELFDAKGRKVHTPKIALAGSEWQSYGVDINAVTIPTLPTLQPPFRVEMIFMESTQGGKGDVLLDDLTAIGKAGRTMRAQIGRVYEGMTFPPSAPVIPKYRIRNGTETPLTTALEVQLFNSFDPNFKSPLQTLTVPLNVPAWESQEVAVDFGKLPTGHYQAKLKLVGASLAVETLDQIPVMVLNGKRINKTPMWFGGQHSWTWLAHPENEFLVKNVIAPFGFDIYRIGDPVPELANADILQAAMVETVPKELRPGQGDDVRVEPTDYAAYFEWLKKVAREKFLPYKDSIVSIEFYNEPDLPGFCFLPDFDVYLKMHQTFSRAFREVIPGVQIGTGGNTVIHGNEKKGFNKRTYTELAKDTDVAIWHSHGTLEKYIELQRQVEKWLEEGGRPLSQQKLGNSEAGVPTGHSSEERLFQADTLVKKAAWSKSQPTSLFHLWFTTTDAYDPQRGNKEAENWGLVTSNQRIKASGQSYNELIRQLSNTKPGGEVELDARLQSVQFTRDDSTHVWVTWPRQRGAKFIQPLMATGPVRVTDMFGLTRELQPSGGKILLEVAGYPLYLNADAKTKVAAFQGAEYVTYPTSVGGTPGSTIRLPLKFKNIWGKPVRLAVKLTKPDGAAVAEDQFDLADGATASRQLEIPLPADIAWGMQGYALHITGAGPEEDTLPVTVQIAQLIPKIATVSVSTVPKTLPPAGRVELKSKDDVHDLVFDPNTPFWANPDDLSVAAQFAHDQKTILATFLVKDQTHNPAPADGKLFSGDSIQFSLTDGNKLTQIGLTSADGGAGWVWSSPDPSLAGKKLATPVKVTRAGNTTSYEVLLPFEMLGFKYEPGLNLRAAFLANENDGGGRVRVMQWFDGITTGGDVTKFGFMILE